MGINIAVQELEEKCRAARLASRRLACTPTGNKNQALKNIAADLLRKKDEILTANAADLEEGRAAGLAGAFFERLRLLPQTIEGMARDVLAVAALPDPVGEVFDMKTLENGLLAGKKRVPLGVIAAIYESRPNVTTDISSLCLKSGNAVILRGGREALNSNRAIAGIIMAAALRAGIPDGAVQFIDNTDHALVEVLLRLNKYIDLVVPRGGAGLISFVRDNSSIPVVAGGIGLNHTYVDRAADLEKAVKIIYNAKVQRPSVCNSLNTILVHQNIAAACLPAIAASLTPAGVELRCDPESFSLLKASPSFRLKSATPEDWSCEFLDLIANVKVVASLDEALAHIEHYGVGHSECIVTEDYAAAMRFLNEVDAACVFVNASTRFNDGGQLGLGAEVGISTQKMHARGPMGLREITGYKWIIFGTGQVRD
jgi:glutamate-5-semialdehyde dehydrogenase